VREECENPLYEIIAVWLFAQSPFFAPSQGRSYQFVSAGRVRTLYSEGPPSLVRPRVYTS
jgi:hypothetical protein